MKRWKDVLRPKGILVIIIIVFLIIFLVSPGIRETVVQGLKDLFDIVFKILMFVAVVTGLVLLWKKITGKS
jgi:hypothetical protein